MSAERFIEVMTTPTLQAGAVARRLQGRVPNRPKEGASPEAQACSVADLASQDVLLLAVQRAFPEAAVDAEEEADLAERFPREEPGRPVVVIDPIDGSLNYLEGSSDYAVMIGWCENGRYEAGIVCFPALGRTFIARTGQGVRELDAGAEPMRLERIAPRIVAVTGGIDREVCGALARGGWEVVRTRCSAVDGAAMLLGRARAALSLGRPGRRRAVGCLLAAEAGGVVLLGEEDWDRRDPAGLEWQRRPTLVAEDEETAEEIRDLLGGLS